ncbi:MAG: molecular chaperone DnaJ [Candidatus Zixiibacteriota bacterium]
MAQKDYYKILGVAESVSADEIKKTYRRLAKKYHPDANPGNKAAEEKFKEISEANEVLSNPQKRKEYDQLRKFGAGGPRGFEGFDFEGFRRGTGRTFSFEDLGGLGGFSDLFSSFFDRGERSRQKRWSAQKGQDFYAEIEIPFDLAISGGKYTFEIRKEDTCPVCHGSGAQPSSKITTCPECGGSGMVSFSQGAFAIQRPCPRCFGKGKIVTQPCSTCGGSGEVITPKKIAIKIPQGVEHGSNLRLKGQGQPGIAGGPPGDLIIKINISTHRFFERKGADVFCKVPINIAQAMLGSKIRVRTIDGKVDLKIPSGTQSGNKFRLKGRGVEMNGIKGDQYVEVYVEIPKRMTSKQKKMMEDLAKDIGLKY